MGHFGFSYIGLLFLLMLIVPNMIWTKNQPKNYDFKNENKVLLLFERTGQVFVTCTALIFSDFNIKPWSLWTLWLIAASILMILYECWWIRYFRSNKTIKEFYSGFLGVPVAGATLPVVAFLFLGIYGKVIWLILSVIILGIGHIGIHLEHQKSIRS
ncbi:hypothetical protein SDC9_143933 [bioreactor metagenome]|uniref:Uncharacterized protein n=1 Tax=bioreactor metagenome TaxID=1076179 RepID=A0A645E5W2_9ZZZZ